MILNNFVAEDKPSKLMATMLQSMFPSLNIQTVSFKFDFNFQISISISLSQVKLANINRCVLFNYDTDSKTIEFRH